MLAMKAKDDVQLEIETRAAKELQKKKVNSKKLRND